MRDKNISKYIRFLNPRTDARAVALRTRPQRLKDVQREAFAGKVRGRGLHSHGQSGARPHGLDPRKRRAGFILSTKQGALGAGKIDGTRPPGAPRGRTARRALP